MVVLICGSRNWNKPERIAEELLKLHTTNLVSLIIEGEAHGADKQGRAAAEGLGIEVKPFPAAWSQYGKAAGHIRNQQMLAEGKPDYCLAFHEDITNSKGTKDMLKRLDKANVPYLLFDK